MLCAENVLRSHKSSEHSVVCRLRRILTLTYLTGACALYVSIMSGCSKPASAEVETRKRIDWAEFNHATIQGRIAELGKCVTVVCKCDRNPKDGGPKKVDKGFRIFIQSVDGVKLKDKVELDSKTCIAAGTATDIRPDNSSDWELYGYETGQFVGIPTCARSNDVQSTEVPFGFTTLFVYSRSKALP